MAQAKRGEFSLGWTVLLGCAIGVACGASPVPYNTIGFFAPELAKEYGWGFGQIMLGVSIYGIMGALLAPLFGFWADRYGAKRVALLSLFLFGLAFASFVFTGANILTFYASWVLVGLVGIGSTPVTFSRLVNQWFLKHRGLALGMMLIGTSVSALVIAPLVTWAIAEFGWRQAHLVIAALPLLVGLPLGLLLLREPTPAEAPEVTGDGRVTGVTLGEALKNWRFWVMWLSIILIAFAYGGAHINMPEIVKMHGFAREQAVQVMQLVALSILLGRLVTGFLLDRFQSPIICMPILMLPAVSCLLLAGQTPDFALVMVGAFLLGFAAGAESDLIAYLASRYFGLAHYGKIYGMLYMPFAFAAAISPAVYGRVRDVTGNYDAILYVAAGMFLVGGLLIAALGRYPVLKPAAA
ncbi:MFS transporter [Sandaracinobacteroides saxicola]|uniref:MFS transporter n=1 Tax=Sandaracinobacteroides saxicola TaxID=2759707 RepID=A0A7G5IGL0_9SPHN|nr:MFS transporter [Sandaracinobacteroides saxicola]QMW22502.1 MFS transporter [Sandaracinobacteroides saxicola]